MPPLPWAYMQRHLSRRQRNQLVEGGLLQAKHLGHLPNHAPQQLLLTCSEFRTLGLPDLCPGATSHRMGAHLHDEASAKVVGADDVHLHLLVVRVGQALQGFNKLPWRAHAHDLVHLLSRQGCAVTLKIPFRP